MFVIWCLEIYYDGNYFWRQFGTGEFTTMSIGVLSGGDGRSLSIASDLSSSKSIEEVTMIVGESLVSNGGDPTIFSGDNLRR